MILAKLETKLHNHNFNAPSILQVTDINMPKHKVTEINIDKICDEKLLIMNN